MRLNINVNSNKFCRLVASDKTKYEETQVNDIVKHVFVEFMVYFPYLAEEENLLALDNSKKITYFTNDSDYNSLDRHYSYHLKRDGRYRYYKYGLYTIEHPSIFNGQTYTIAGKVFFHNDIIYYGINDTNQPIFDKDNSIVIDNWYKLREYFAYGIDFFYDIEMFTICNLNQCLIALQKKAIFAGLKNCNYGVCEENKSLKLQRDFLFISVYVLDYLIEIGNYLEAQRILEALSTCGNLCNDNMLMNNNCCN